MPRRRCRFLLLATGLIVVALPLASRAQPQPGTGRPDLPKVLPLRDRVAVEDRWLRLRLESVLPMVMRREGFDMWIIDNQEYDEDPVFFSLMPATTMAARRRTILVIYDPGPGQPLERYAVSRYGIGDFYRGAWNPEQEPDQYQALARLVEEKKPKKIGINTSEVFAFGDGLSANSLANLRKALPRPYLDRLAGADRLAVGWLEHRTEAEMEAYDGICAIAHGLITRAFSSEVIHPGVTRSADVVWWFRQAFADLDLETWFQPSVDIIRRGETNRPESDGDIIRPGDVLHCDVGIVYLRLCTDTQELAYVLRPGESDVPEGLKRALANGNRLQDILMGNFAGGRTGNEILRASLEGVRTAGLKGSIYTHPLGYYGHGPGPTIGLWDQQGGVPGKGDYPLFARTVYSIELNATTAVPEWGGQEVTLGLEQDGYFDGTACRFLDGRQTAWHIIR
jgi:Xaa-Pro aminopeptidase